MPWDNEHGNDYAVPREILNLSGIRDISWHNDSCPHFLIPLCGERVLSLFVEHPEESKRESPDPRFILSICDEHDGQLSEGEFIQATDDLSVLIDVIVGTRRAAQA